MWDFSGTTLVVSGAGAGIGRAVATLFHAAGASVVATDISASSLEHLTTDLGEDRLATLVSDAADRIAADATAAMAVSRFGGIDFVIPSAGIYPRRHLAEMTDDEWRQIMAINLDGVFYLTRATIPHLREGGAIVNLASLAAHRGSAGHAHYAATKGALVSFTRSLAHELAPAIRVNAIAPGIIGTPTALAQLGEKDGMIVRATPLGRIGTAAEVASVAAFLCSSAAAFVTGEIIQVNGGLFISG